MSMYDIEIKTEKLEEVLKTLADETGGRCLETSVFVGAIHGKPIRLTVMTAEEAEDSHEYDETDTRYNCIDA